MKKWIFLSLALHAIYLSGQEVTNYQIVINQADPFKIKVKAIFPLAIDTLYIHSSCPNYDYPEGWSTFIKPQSANLKFLGNSKWIAQGKEISYEVDLSFVKKNWDVGNEQAGLYIDQSMFVATRALFLSPPSDQKFEVKFDLPKDFVVTTPWTSLGSNRFLVSSRQELMNNTVVWGLRGPETIKEGNFKLNFILLGYDKKISNRVRKTFKAVLKEYLELFPQTPNSNYLITVFPFEQNDGEAYESSNAFSLKSPISDDNKIIWANLFAHELFHFWNGKMINTADSEETEWFSEGFTEYYSNLALIRSKVLSETAFYRTIEKTIGLYYYFKNSQYRKLSIMEAGTGDSYYRFGVYNGGWCAAFVMDMMIREKLAGKSLDDFMHFLFEKYALPGKICGLNELKVAFQEFMGSDTGDYFGKYISGAELLPLESYFQSMGISLDYTDYEGTAFLFSKPGASAVQREKQGRWMK